MRWVIMIVFLQGAILASDFITNMEYAKMLYQNPRGIGCDKCHGPHGEGLVLSSYTNNDGERIEIRAPRIDNLSHQRFTRVFEKHSKLMPDYFLTRLEVASLYYYLTQNPEKERIANAN